MTYLATNMANIKTKEEMIEDADGDEMLIEFFSEQKDWNFPTDDEDHAIELAKQRLIDNPNEKSVAVIKLVKVIRRPETNIEDLTVEEA